MMISRQEWFEWNFRQKYACYVEKISEFTDNHHDAEDIVMTAYQAALKSRGKIESMYPSPYFNEARNKIAKAKLLCFSDIGLKAEDIPNKESESLGPVLERALNVLKPHEYEMFLTLALTDMLQREYAAEKGLSKNTVKRRMMLVRDKLARRVTELGKNN
ncbi:hypothetical protein KY329_01510 [Candidatus Woesearchaeota archaeon]|nr:hypothetical protein [Candidatus Woesearchaeota archaeon]